MNEPILTAASELVDRLGTEATQWVQNRIAALQDAGDMRAADEAYQLLTAVENILVQRYP